MAITVHTSRNNTDSYPKGVDFEIAIKPEGALYIYDAVRDDRVAKCLAVYAPGSWASAKITE